MVYQIVDLDIHNPELYAGYVAKVADIVRKHDGRSPAPHWFPYR
jgi:uncharacterized protein (DUF1330 family)